MNALTLPVDKRRELVNSEVTLNGKPAAICGIKNDFATVAQLPDGPSYEFSWLTVEHIIDTKGGAFSA